MLLCNKITALQGEKQFLKKMHPNTPYLCEYLKRFFITELFFRIQRF